MALGHSIIVPHLWDLAVLPYSGLTPVGQNSHFSQVVTQEVRNASILESWSRAGQFGLGGFSLTESLFLGQLGNVFKFKTLQSVQCVSGVDRNNGARALGSPTMKGAQKMATSWPKLGSWWDNGAPGELASPFIQKTLACPTTYLHTWACTHLHTCPQPCPHLCLLSSGLPGAFLFWTSTVIID